MPPATPFATPLGRHSDSIKVAAGVKTSLNVRPTVFIAFGNSLQHPNHDAPGKASLGMLLAAQRPCGFPGVEGRAGPRSHRGLPLADLTAHALSKP